MRKVLPLFLLLIAAGCGSGGGGPKAQVGVSDVPAKLQQDLICYMEQTDSTGKTVYLEEEPTAKSVTFTLKYSSLCPSSFTTKEQDLIFEGCSVSVVPVSKLPDEMKSQEFLTEMAQEITCTADDVVAGGSANGRVSLTAALVDLMKTEYTKYKSYAPFLYKVNVTFKFSSNCSDGTIERTVSIPVEFSNFVENSNDLCQQ